VTTAYDPEEFRIMWDYNMPTAKIGKRLGCSSQQVSALARLHGLPPRSTNGVSMPGEAIQAAYAAGYSLREIKHWLSRRFRVSVDSLSALLKRRGVKVEHREEHRLPPLGVL
jgi:hypothetical protein